MQGCVSQVWVVPEVREGKMFWKADSDAQLTKGLAALLVQGLSGSAPEDIVKVEADFIEMLGLKQSLTPSRNNGFLNMFRLMQVWNTTLLCSPLVYRCSSSMLTCAFTNRLSCPALVCETFINVIHSLDGSYVEWVSCLSGMRAQARAALNGAAAASSNGADRSNLVDQALADDDAAAASTSSDAASSRSVHAVSVDPWTPTPECPKPVAASIRNKLAELGAESLEIIDDSASHAGHAGARGTNSPSGETHFKVRIVSEEFAGMNTVKRHRTVYGLLADELAGPLHALNLETKTPTEVRT